MNDEMCNEHNAKGVTYMVSEYEAVRMGLKPRQVVEYESLRDELGQPWPSERARPTGRGITIHE